MFTADPIELVPDLPADAPEAAIAAAFAAVPWADLEDDAAAFAAAISGAAGSRLRPARPAAGRPPRRRGAVRAGGRPGRGDVPPPGRGRLDPDSFEFEVAVDEIEYRTTPVDHVYLATELHRLGVRWVSFAPRFVGEFEKGIDYLGDRAELEADVEIHAAIARRLGDYKLSVHSGSDKFSIYDAVARATRDRVHLKTSGTSYLVALQTIAAADPELMRRVWRVGAGGLHDGSGELSRFGGTGRGAVAGRGVRRSAGRPARRPEHSRDPPRHLRRGPPRLSRRWRRSSATTCGRPSGREREAYWSNLEAHIGRHLRPFSQAAGRPATKGATR